MSFRSYPIFLLIFLDQVPLESSNTENLDRNFWEESGESGVNKKLTNGFSDPHNPYNDCLKK